MTMNLDLLVDDLVTSIEGAARALSPAERERRDSDIDFGLWAVKLAIINARRNAEREGRYASGPK